MNLRAELMPPVFDEEKVARLTDLAENIDGAAPGEWEEWLEEFNREAGTNYDFYMFQGLYGGDGHEPWVRSVLCSSSEKRLPDITREELVELVRRVTDVKQPEHAKTFWLEMLAINIPDDRISDLIFWPGDYFGDGDNSRDFTPEQVVEIALERAKERETKTTDS